MLTWYISLEFLLRVMCSVKHYECNNVTLMYSEDEIGTLFISTITSLCCHMGVNWICEFNVFRSAEQINFKYTLFYNAGALSYFWSSTFIPTGA